MTTTMTEPAAATTQPRSPWRAVLRSSAAATIVLAIAHQWLNRFFGISLVALAVLTTVGLLLEFNRRRAGTLLLAGTSVLFLAVHAFILVLTVRHVELAETFITVSGLVVALALMLIAAIQTLRSSQNTQQRSARTATVVAVGVGTLWAAAGVYSLTVRMHIDDVRPVPGELVVDVSDAPASAPSIEVAAGEAVVFHNLDDSPLLIESARAGLGLAVPAHYSRRVTLDLDPGTYRYTIDGPDKRITGTLTVR